MSENWRYYCIDEAKNILEDRSFTQGAPTTCKNDSSHTINNVVIVYAKDQTLQQVGGAISSPKQGTYLITGGLILQGGTGLTFYMTKAIYVINDQTYEFPGGTVTLSTANGSNPRIDVIYLDTESVLGKITGTPATVPVKPDISSNILELYTVRVDTNAITPSITVSTVYRNNTGTTGGEYTATESTGGDRINVDSALNPLSGIKSIHGNGVIDGDSITFTSVSPVTGNGSLTFSISIINNWSSSMNFRVAMFNAGNRISNWILIKDGMFGFSRSGVGYQRIAISASLFNYTDLFDSIQIQFVGSGTVSFTMDQIQLQSVSSSNEKFTSNNITNLTSGSGVSLIETTGGGITSYRSLVGDGINVVSSGGSIILSVNPSAINHDQLNGVSTSNSHPSYVQRIGDTMSGGLNVQQTTESLSNNTGALIIGGGLGVGKRINNAGALGDLLIGDGTTMSKLGLGDDGYILVSTGGTASWEIAPSGEISSAVNIGGGSTILDGKYGTQYRYRTLVANNSTISYTTNGTTISLSVNSSVVSHNDLSGRSDPLAHSQYSLKSGDTFSGSIIVANTVNTTGTGTGSVVINGGGSVSLDWIVGGSIVAQDAIINGTSVLGGTTINNVVVNSSSVFNGNAIFNSNVSINGSLSTVNIYSSTITTSTLTVSSNITVGGDLIVNGTVTFGSGVGFTGPLVISDTTQSTDKDTGAVIIEGGVGVEKNLNVGQNLSVIGNIQGSSISSSGSLSVLSINSSRSINGAGALGDLLVGDGTTLSVRSIGTAGQLLTSSSGTASWITPTPVVGSNIGSGIELYSTNDSSTLKFKTLTSNATTVSVVNNGTTVNLDVLASSISHGSLSNLGNNDHPQYAKLIGDTFTGVVNITDLSQSTANNNGSFVVSGGVGIAKNLNVGGNAVISGNLVVVGSVTSINSTITTVSDNTLVINSGPAGSRDTGYFVARWQTANDSSTGDVVNGTIFLSATLTAGSSTTITFPNNAPWSGTSDNFYNGYWIRIVSGTGSGQVRRIKTWVGSSRVATIFTTTDGGTDGLDFTVSPGATSVVNVFGNAFTGLWFNETTDSWIVGGSPVDTLQTMLYTERLPLEARTLSATSSINGASALGDSLIGNGTTMAVRSIGTTGQILTVNGGTAVWSTLNVNATNIGSGVGLYSDSNGYQNRFRSLISNATTISYTNNGTTISLDVNATAISHNNLSGINSNTAHPQYTLRAGDTITGNIIMTNTTPNTTLGTGALILTGGQSIGGNTFIGGNLSVNGSVSTLGITSIRSTVQSTGTANGALIVSGGLAVARNINGAGARGDLLVGNGTNMTSLAVSTDKFVLIASSTSGSQGAIWGPCNAAQLQGYPIQSSVPAVGDVMKYNGTTWSYINVATNSVFLYPLFQKDPNGGDYVSVSTSWTNYGQIGWNQSRYNQLTTTTINAYVDLRGRDLQVKVLYNNGGGDVNLIVGGVAGVLTFTAGFLGNVSITYTKPTVNCLLQVQLKSGTATLGNTAPRVYQLTMEYGF